MAMEPTAEQHAAREVFAAGRDLALVAGAGTGKISTLILMGASVRKSGLERPPVGGDVEGSAVRRARIGDHEVLYAS
jgi:hypothetical protein